jgi:transcriptional regulator with XRE-family HTH domain
VEITNQLADPGVLAELSGRLKRLRLRRNLTQAQLAHEAGISKRTLERFEAGESTQLLNFIRICRALHLLGNLETLVPETLPSPLEQLQRRGKERQRASGRTEAEAAEPSWTWGEEG